MAGSAWEDREGMISELLSLTFLSGRIACIRCARLLSRTRMECEICGRMDSMRWVEDQWKEWAYIHAFDVVRCLQKWILVNRSPRRERRTVVFYAPAVEDLSNEIN